MPIPNFKSESFSRGFDLGNFGNAYVWHGDWDDWVENLEMPEDIEDLNECDFHSGLLLGFFSSFEVSEIGDPDLADQVEALRALKGDD